MKFTISNRGLKPLLAKLAGVPGSKSTAPGASAVIVVADELEGITMKRITPEGSAQITFPADVAEEGKVALEFSALQRLSAKYGEEDIKFSEDAKSIVARCGSGRDTLAKWVGDLPEDHPPIKAQKVLTFPSCDFLRWINITSPAMSTEESRANICGICVRSYPGGKLTMFGTDGRRIHIAIMGKTSGPVFPALDDGGNPTGRDDGIMFSADSVGIIKKSLAEDKGNVRVSASRSGILIEVEGTVIRLPAIATPPPSIDGVIIETPPDVSFSVNKVDFLAAVQRAIPCAYGPGQMIGLAMTPGAVRVDADNRAGHAYDEEVRSAPTKTEGGIAFNSGYMTTILGQAAQDMIDFGYYRKNNALMIREDDRCLIIMMMRADEYGYEKL